MNELWQFVTRSRMGRVGLVLSLLLVVTAAVGPALAPYDVEIQKEYEATENPAGWGGLGGVPHYIMLQSKSGGQ